MKTLTFSGRCAKEIIREPLNLFFGLGFPVVLLLLLSAIQSNVPVNLFRIEHLAPGITVFGLSFMTLFSATLIAKDRESSLMQRLYTTPLKASDFILGYMLPIIPIATAQSVVCYTVSVFLGLPVTVNIIKSVFLLIPVSVLYISLGLLFGSILNSKQVGGICGALLTNLSAWLSGIWFDIELAGETFKKIADLLPFVHAVELQRAVINGTFGKATTHLYYVVGYTIVITLLAVLMFLRQMKKQ